jgi:transposase
VRIAWPLGADLTDAMLEQRLFANAGVKSGHRRHAEPDWARVHREMRRKHVTLSILWEEDIALHPVAIGTRGFAICTGNGKAVCW